MFASKREGSSFIDSYCFTGITVLRFTADNELFVIDVADDETAVHPRCI
jgi:hypothetical protein